MRDTRLLRNHYLNRIPLRKETTCEDLESFQEQRITYLVVLAMGLPSQGVAPPGLLPRKEAARHKPRLSFRIFLHLSMKKHQHSHYC